MVEINGVVFVTNIRQNSDSLRWSCFEIFPKEIIKFGFCQHSLSSVNAQFYILFSSLYSHIDPINIITLKFFVDASMHIKLQVLTTKLDKMMSICYNSIINQDHLQDVFYLANVLFSKLL